MSSPRVSVLMSVYNAATHLDAAVASVAAQDFADWELVAVDDGSTDASPDILRRWAERDGRVRPLTNASNKGQTACLNQGLAECRADWVARQDADDLSHPGRLRKQMSFLAARPETALLGTAGVLIDGAGGLLGLLDVPTDAAAIAWCAPFLNPFLHTAVVFRKEIVQREGGYDENYRIAQDYELWTRLAARHRAANLPHRLVSYRHAENSLSNKSRDAAFAEADVVSDREALRRYGRPWRAREKELAGGFRRGALRPPQQREFWQLVSMLEDETNATLPARLRAMWHLRLAGAAGLRAPAEVAAALHADPLFAVPWLVRRFAGV